MEEFNLYVWLDEIRAKIKQHFGSRVIFIGYQGSYVRGEETPDSDIDVVLILDKLTLDDLKTYKNIIKSMSHSEKACGFISGKAEIQNRSKTDMFQFMTETKPLFGSLFDFITPLSETDIRDAVKIGSDNLYHAVCHSFLYDGDIRESLSGLCKAAFFILQAEYFLKTSRFLPTKAALSAELSGDDNDIPEICMNTKLILSLPDNKVEALYAKLLKYCSEKITQIQ